MPLSEQMHAGIGYYSMCLSQDIIYTASERLKALANEDTLLRT